MDANSDTAARRHRPSGSASSPARRGSASTVTATSIPRSGSRFSAPPAPPMPSSGIKSCSIRASPRRPAPTPTRRPSRRSSWTPPREHRCPAGAPALRAGLDGRAGWPPNVMRRQNCVISWPATTTTNYVLEAADSLSASSWTTVTNITRRAERPVGGRRGTQRGPQVLPHAAWPMNELPAIAVRPMPASTRATRSGDLPLRAGPARRFHAH